MLNTYIFIYVYIHNDFIKKHQKIRHDRKTVSK